MLVVNAPIAKAYRTVLQMEHAFSTPMLGRKSPTATGNQHRLPTYPVQEQTTRSTWMTAAHSIKYFAITASQTATTSLHPLEETTWTALATARTYSIVPALRILTVFAHSRPDWVRYLVAHVATVPILSSWYPSVL
jgi:hypothetical protein